jgi:hypothetical protein
MALHQRLIALFSLLLIISSASLLWAAGGEDGIAICVATNVQYRPAIAELSGGTSIIAWQDYRGATSDIYVQKINAAGVAYWTSDGIAVCTASGSQYDPVVASDGAGGGFVTWYDNRSGNEDIYAQHVNSSGVPLWTQNGVCVCGDQSSQSYPQIAPDGAGGAIIVWLDARSGSYDIYAQRLNASGNALWTAGGKPICEASGTQYMPVIIPYSGGAFLAWPDERSGSIDVYAQKLNLSGNSLWTANGVPVCAAASKQNHVQLTSDGAGGIIVAWRDRRSGVAYDIYAQRIDASGCALWTTDGVPICTATKDQNSPSLTPDGSGGAIMAWEDFRNPTFDIYAQRINASGSTQWQSDGVKICDASDSQYNPKVVTDCSGGAIIGWEDYRSGNWDLYSQRVSASGSVQWSNNGVMICNASGTQYEIRLVSNGAGGATYTWSDERSGVSACDIFSNNIDQSGKIGVLTAVKMYYVSLENSNVRIDWELSDMGIGMAYSIMRAEGSHGTFVELPAPEIVQTDMSFTFTDTDCRPGKSYRYRVDVTDEDGTKILFETSAIAIPDESLALHPNYPNPFNPSTMISFFLPEESRVTLTIINAEGKQVVRLLSDVLPAGEKEIVWNGTDANGNEVGSGVYFCRLTAGKNVLNRKMVLVK